MGIAFEKSSYVEIKDMVDRYIETLSSPIDSYLEEHILTSEHFMIRKNDVPVGYFSIHNKELLTQFFIFEEYRSLSQKIYFEIKKMQNVRFAYVPTCDEFFMSHALDDFSRIEKQAYFFKDIGRKNYGEDLSCDVVLKLAKLSDVENILELSGDFFDRLEDRIEMEQIYIALQNNEVVGFGIIEKGILLGNYSSTGMYTVENKRQKGIGRSILIKLKEKVYEDNRTPIAGCWYYNHFSKKTLESSGYHSDTRLLKIHY